MNKKFALKLIETTMRLIVSLFSMLAVQAQTCSAAFWKTKMSKALEK
ncbi:hypothetical protein [Gottschalkia acidurici]|nr:hypothetical protein [Gottschalkia acidurici]